eukprot:jgi/Antlo1/575/1476
MYGSLCMVFGFESKIVSVLQELKKKLEDYDAKIENTVNKIAEYSEQLKSEYAELQEKRSQKLRQIYEIVNSN